MKRKGQSATEYLMTYGWALLAIAIVGALLYMYVFSNKECIKKVEGFKDQGVVVIPNQYQVYTNGSIVFMIENRLQENATVKKIVITDERGNEVSSCTPATTVELDPGARKTVGLGGDFCQTLTAVVANEGACKKIGIKITYGSQSGLKNAIASGSIIAQYVKP